MLTIDVAIATWKDGIERVEKMLLPPRVGVRYVVSWQAHRDAPLPAEIAGRLSRECAAESESDSAGRTIDSEADGDVEVWRFDEAGLSANRNNALSHCRGDVVVVADDDLILSEEGLRNVRNAFCDMPEMDVALFKVEFPIAKPYPARSCRIGVPFPRGYWVSAVEIAFRRKSMGELRFHPELGLGSQWLESGEDEMFVVSAIRRGLHCRFVDKWLCAHPSLTTGSSLTPGILRGQGALIRIIYPESYILRVLLKAWRNRSAGFFPTLRHLLEGVTAERRLLQSHRCYRW